MTLETKYQELIERIEVLEKEITRRDAEVKGINTQLDLALDDHRWKGEQLLISEENLSMTQEIAHIGSWKFDVNSGYLFWSDELFRIYGLEAGVTELRLEHGLGMIHPEDRPFAEKVFERAVNEGLGYEIEYRIIRPDGESPRCARRSFRAEAR